jgi:hypothetical protein
MAQEPPTPTGCPAPLQRRKRRRLKVCYRRQQQEQQETNEQEPPQGEQPPRNLFVRLHPRTVQALHQDAATAAAAAEAEAEDVTRILGSSKSPGRIRTRRRRANAAGASYCGVADGECWHISKTTAYSKNASEMLDFLPLAIQRIFPQEEEQDNDSPLPLPQIVYASYNGGELLYSSSSPPPPPPQQQQQHLLFGQTEGMYEKLCLCCY